MLQQTCPGCGRTVDTGDAEPLARVECPHCGEKVRAERSFDQFVLLETVGIGGMGTVYKARDTLLDRLVALKLLRKDLGDGIDHAARLQQEARVAASVNHPNVVQVFSSGLDHGQFYLVMELVDHGSLDDFIEQKKQLSEELVLEAGIQVAKGLRAAYAKDLIHRDVKPANILFADEHTAKIGDFGLAGVAAEGAEVRGEIWGTPYYVAPERLNNEAEDFRSDIYSLGATLFHAIAGRAPIEGETNSAVTLRSLKDHPLDLSKAAPKVSAPTVRILNRMIAPDPARRFSSYDELVRELENAYGLLTGKEEFLARRRSKLPWIIGVAVLLVALIGVGVWAIMTGKHSQRALTAAAARTEQLVALAPLEAQAAQGRKELLRNHYRVAGAAFARVATDARGKQPLYDWARFQQGLAAMIGQESSLARQSFQDVENAGETGFTGEDSGLAQFFMKTSRTLLASGAIPAKPGPNNPAPYSSFSFLLFGLKDIGQSDAEAARSWLEQFVSATPTGKFSWIGDYKPIAQKYLQDCKLYLEWKKEGDQAHDPAALAKHLETTRNIIRNKQFKTRSPLSDQIYVAETTLAHEIALREKTERENRERDQQKRTEETARELARKKPLWLRQWKKQLIEDLNRSHFSGAVTDRTGVQYTGILRATDSNLTMKLPYGEAQLPWGRLSHETLLKVSASFIKPSGPDAAERNWLCAVYASETGQSEEARKLAAEAAKEKPEYRDQAPMLVH